MSKRIVRVINKTGNPADTKVMVDGKPLPLSHMLGATIHIEPDGIMANIRLLIDDIDTLAQVNIGGEASGHERNT